jgi:glycerophosphoryl diester phosphodiesterase
MATKIIAHRGYSDKYPENTLTAFKAALDHGSDAIELDVHMTSDGQLVVHHDYYLGNPDNGEGLIFEKDLAHIKGLKIGDNETIPTLEEVFKLVGDKIQYELELKGFTNEFLQKVVDLVKRFDLAGNIEFTSPTVYNLTKLKQLEPSFKTGTFAAPFPGWMDKELGQTLLINGAKLGGINVLHCPLDMIDEQLVASAHDSDLLVHAADCNTEETLQKAFTLGVDQLSTNMLELALEARSK